MDVGGYRSAHGFVLVVLLLCGGLSWWYLDGDPTPGLAYRSGDRPEELPKQLCFSDSGPCPPTGFRWRIPAGGTVQTRLRLDDPERRHLLGEMLLTASTVTGTEVRDCPAAVDWTLRAGGTALAGRPLRANGRGRDVAGDAPRAATELTLTAPRTDREPCAATLQWSSAGLYT